jgi:hypothetical protein
MLLGAANAGAQADALPTLSGRWKAEPLTVRWVIGEWGEACGPRPSGGGDSGGEVTIEQSPEELAIRGTGRTYSSAECWEMHPGLARASHTGGQRAWSNVCTSTKSDARQELLRTTITATDDVISLQETGQYHFVVGGQTCSASSGRWRTYRLLQRAGEPDPGGAILEPKPGKLRPDELFEPSPPGTIPPKPETAPSELALAESSPAPSARLEAPESERPKPPEPERPRRADPCATPGPPSQIELRPALKLLRAGEEFTFRARVLDARGCRSPVAVSWKLEAEPGVGKLEQGKLTIVPDAPEAEVGVVATAAQQSVRASVQVVSSERYASLLEAGGFNADGAMDAAAVAIISASSIGTQGAQSEGTPEGRKWAFVGIVGLAAVVLGVIGAVVLTVANRGRRKRSESVRPATVVAAAATAPLPQQPARPAAPAPPRSVCPVCGTFYTGSEATCVKDGAALLPVNAPSVR